MSKASQNPRLRDALEISRQLSPVVERPGARRVLKVSAAGACGDAITVFLPGCNLACVHCWAGPDREAPHEYGRFMSYHQIREAVRRFRQHNRLGVSTLSLRLSGGEPILSELFLEFLEGLLAIPGLIFIETNGVVLGQNPQWLPRLEAHGSRIFLKVSIKAASVEQYSRITHSTPGAFESTWQCIEQLSQSKVPFDLNSLCLAPQLFREEERIALLDRLGAINPDLPSRLEQEQLTDYPGTRSRMNVEETPDHPCTHDKKDP